MKCRKFEILENLPIFYILIFDFPTRDLCRKLNNIFKKKFEKLIFPTLVIKYREKISDMSEKFGQFFRHVGKNFFNFSDMSEKIWLIFATCRKKLVKNFESQLSNYQIINIISFQVSNQDQIPSFFVFFWWFFSFFFVFFEMWFAFWSF